MSWIDGGGGEIVGEEKAGDGFSLLVQESNDSRHEFKVLWAGGEGVSSSCCLNQLSRFGDLGKGKGPWKFKISFSALLLPIQCALVPSSRTSLFGVTPFVLHQARYASSVGRAT